MARVRIDSARRTLAVLAPATFFDGYDGLILGLALPLIRSEFDLSVAQAGLVGGVVFAGGFGALALIAAADRIGRRPALTLSIIGYTIATFLTALSVGVLDFVAYQFVARVFLGAERTLANIVVVETVPEQRRGRALAILAAMFAVGQAAAGLGFAIVNTTGSSWRMLYLMGIVPLLVVARARRDLPETLGLSGAPRPPIRTTLNPRWTVGAGVLGFLFNVFPTALVVFASTIVLEEWDWALTDIDPRYFVWWGLSLSGFFVAGRLIDAWGRRPAAVLFFGGAALTGIWAFGMAGSDPGRAVGLGLVIFFLTGAAPCNGALTTEPFPIEARGRVGAMVRLADIGGSAAAPALAGLLAGPLGGVGPAVAATGISYAFAAAAVVGLMPETRHREAGLGSSEA
jgi:putative MFS transporter